MRFHIEHVTIYRYSGPAFLEPHVVRLRPMSNYEQTLRGFNIKFDPTPAGVSTIIDTWGNSVTRAWFEATTESLRIQTACKVETHRPNPFDYLLQPEAMTLPFTYEDATAAALSPCLKHDGEPGDALHRLAEDLANEVGRDTVPFVSALNRRLHELITIEIRHDGVPYAPQQTLASRCGACRDVAVLFVAVCRQMGLAARFVSGYQYGGDEADGHELHAWAEVYLPGGGWRGFDPTSGLAVNDDHITLAAAHDPLLAAPTTGSFRGTGVTAEMETHLAIKAIDET